MIDDVISIDDYLYYVDDALDGIADIVRGLGDDAVNARPPFPGANSPYAIAAHCLGVMEHWGGAAVAGRTIQRDRAAEFTSSGRVEGLIDRLEAAKHQLRLDVTDLDPGAPPHGEPDPQDAGHPAGRSRGGALMHLYEELAQHRGQLEVTRDLLQPSGGR